MVAHKTKHTLATLTSNHVPSYLPKAVEHFCPHKNVHMEVYSSFIHNCQNLEAAKMPLSRCVDKETVVHAGHAILLSANKTVVTKWRKDLEEPECISPGEGRQCEKAASYTIPTLGHSGKGQAMETVRGVVARRTGEGRTRGMHTTKGDPHVDYRVWVMRHCRSIHATNVLLWWVTLIEGRLCSCQGRRDMGKSLHLPLNLKLFYKKKVFIKRQRPPHPTEGKLRLDSR